MTESDSDEFDFIFNELPPIKPLSDYESDEDIILSNTDEENSVYEKRKKKTKKEYFNVFKSSF